MSSFTPRSSQDLNRYYSNAPASMPQYTNSHNANYVYAGQNHYGVVNPSYSDCSAQYVSTYSNPASYTPTSSHISTQGLQTRLPFRGTSDLQSHQGPIQEPHNFPRDRSTSGATQMHGFVSVADQYHVIETESQESRNEATMDSEPVIPPLAGLPDVHEFDVLIKEYIQKLSVKKRDKALIHARRARNIRQVLLDPKTTGIESAQFRFWVKKMFRLCPDEPNVPPRRKKVCHEGKPVAIREKLFKILSKAHEQCQHGGRDKTSAQVRRVYSWVPKELIANYVKICPTCQARRGSVHLTPPNSGRSSPTAYSPSYGSTTGMLSPPDSRRDSIVRYPLSSEGQSGLSSPESYNVNSLQTQQFWLNGANNPQSHLAMQAGHTNGSTSGYTSMTSALGGTVTYGHSSLPSTNLTHTQYNGGYLNDHMVKREAY